MRNDALAVLVLSIVVGCSMPGSSASPDAFSTVTYRGEVIPLARQYTDFHDYRDDDDNLPISQRARVADLVRSAPVPQSFSSRKEADDTFYYLMFPGYGYSLLQLQSPIALYSLEVPKAGEDRWFTVVQRGPRWVVIDDFIWPEKAGYIAAAEISDGKLQYLDRQRHVLREKVIAQA